MRRYALRSFEIGGLNIRREVTELQDVDIGAVEGASAVGGPEVTAIRAEAADKDPILAGEGDQLLP